MQEFLDWLAVLLRWGHVMAGIAWIGTSFYFNWFDLSVRPPDASVKKENVRGTLHEIHGGSFYYHEQYWPDHDHPRMLAHSGPAQLTFLSGIALMAVIYWYGASVYLIDPQVARLTKAHAILLSMSGIAVAWPLYYKLIRCVRDDRIVFVWMTVAVTSAAWLFTGIFGARAAFIQVGAMLGTIMALSVHFVIVPNHIQMRRQIQKGEPLDTECGKRAKRVSTHNNYFTLPVIFAMLSSHFPQIVGHPLNWVIMILIMGFGVTLRHWRNLQFKTDRSDRRLLFGAFVLLAAGIGVSRINFVQDAGQNAAAVSAKVVMDIVHQRCTVCHSAQPTDENFPSAPLGFRLDTIEQLTAGSDKVAQRAVRSREMPPGNVTNMTDEERAALSAWLSGNRNEGGQ
jgi:uncharacterized membrane protein